MSKYPRLTEMGVNNPAQIEKFAIYTIGNTDVLQIVYDRKKGSLLPVIRRYKFPQVKESVLVDSGTRQTEVIWQSTPAFREAVHELETLKKERAAGQDLKAMLKEEIRLLQEDIALRAQYIDSLIDQIK